VRNPLRFTVRASRPPEIDSFTNASHGRGSRLNNDRRIPQTSNSHSPIGPLDASASSSSNLADEPTLGIVRQRCADSAPFRCLKSWTKRSPWHEVPIGAANAVPEPSRAYIPWVDAFTRPYQPRLESLITSPPLSIGDADGTALEIDANTTIPPEDRRG
jgi:hypothetical protein